MGNVMRRLVAIIFAFAMVLTHTTVRVNAETFKLFATTQEKVYEEDGYTVTYQVMELWWGGYNGTVIIENTGDTVIKDWYLKATIPNSISNILNGNLYSNEGDEYTIANAGWNCDIAPGEYVRVGFSSEEDFEGFTEETFIVISTGDSSDEDIEEPDKEAVNALTEETKDNEITGDELTDIDTLEKGFFFDSAWENSFAAKLFRSIFKSVPAFNLNEATE